MSRSNIPYIYIVLISLLLPTFLSAQTTKIFNGVLLDDETSAPLVDAHVYSNSGYATVSGYNGDFKIPVYDTDTLYITSVGYGKTYISVADCGNYSNNELTFRIKPIIYVLRAIEVPLTKSVVIVPEPIKKEVEIEGVKPMEKSAPEVQLGDYTSVSFTNAKYDRGLPFFGVGITINGFLSGLFKSGDKNKAELEEMNKIDESQKVFYNYIYSSDLKKLLMTDYEMTQEEYDNFIAFFVKNAGDVKKSNNEYEILQAIIKKIDKIKK